MIAFSRFLQPMGRRAASSSLRNGVTKRLTASDTASAVSEQLEPYPRTIQFFHWVVGGGIIGAVIMVQAAMNTTDKKKKGDYMFIHKSLGLLVFGAVIPRAFVRMGARIPSMAMPAWQRAASKLSHFSLYALSVALPGSGIAMGYFGGKGLPFFITTIPGATETNGEIAKNAFKAHKLMGQALEYVFFPMHIGGVAMHAAKGQNVLKRMISASKAANRS